MTLSKIDGSRFCATEASLSSPARSHKKMVNLPRRIVFGCCSVPLPSPQKESNWSLGLFPPYHEKALRVGKKSESLLWKCLRLFPL